VTEKPTNLGDLSPSRRTLLRAMLSEQGIDQEPARQIPRRPDRGPSPLSFAQQRLWFVDQFQPNSPSYNIPVSLQLGPVDAAALARAIEEVVRRHEVLRTRFVIVDGHPMQTVLPPGPVELAIVDLRGVVDPAERDTEIARHSREDVQRPFDIAGGPHFRVKLLQLGPASHVLLLTLHHIIADGWSTGIFLRELTALYGAYVRREPLALPELEIQYADFACWQRNQLTGEVIDEYLRYWKDQLAGSPALLELPTDRPRPAVQSFQGDMKRFSLPSPLVEALRVIAQQEGATIFMVLLAAFKLLLHRYARQDDLVVGTPIANRTHPQIEKLIGPFANTLPLRTRLSGDLTFRELLRRVREVTLSAYSHQDLPFEKLVEELRPERNLSYSPIFQVLFVLQNAPTSQAGEAAGDRGQGSSSGSGSGSGSNDVDTGTAKFDLTMSLIEAGHGISGGVEYDRALFDPDRIERTIGHYKVVLQAIAENPDEPLWRVPILTEAEHRQLTVEWNATARDYGDDQCIQHLFEAQVERSPDAPAVEFVGQQLTYRELNARANQLAHYLKSIGVGPEVRVAICMERSLEVVIAMLGVLKAGGVHTPLDPGYPKERLEFMLSDARIQVVLTQQKLVPLLPQHGLPTILLELETTRLDGFGRDNPPIETVPDNLAYVVYTSGSTGRPKGIAMRHRTMVNLFPWQRRRFRPGTGIRTIQFTSFSFDVSVQEILNTLCVDSGVLVMMPEELRRDPVRIARFLVDQRIQRLFLPFTALHQLAEGFEANDAYPTALQEIVSTGEQMRLTQPIRRALGRVPGIVLHNQYGPSETHFATGYPLTGDPAGWPTLPSIGRPLDNTRIYVLDEHLQPVPIGVPGEVYIGGVPVARGYLERPGQNAEKFVPDAYGGQPGERVYRTGDVAYYRADGNLEYIARRDHQVKVRGYRIELGEIEAALVEHPASQSAVAITRDDAAGHKIVAAYVIPKDGVELTAAEIRRYLKDRLPEYMIPSTLAISRDLPRSPNGKIDRLALSRADDTRPELDTAFAAPRTPNERKLVTIWQQVLGLAQIGIHDNFFELGGHSLLATRVASHIRSEFAIEFPLRRLFEATTVAELAAAVTEECTRQLGGDGEARQLLQELEGMSDDEARALLDDIEGDAGGGPE
jgi:amino acid adenylation domain-containing protein